MTKNDILHILKKHFASLNSEFGVKKIGVFGSYARDAQTDSSDIDIVVEFERPIGLQFVDFTEHVEKILGRKADVLTPAGIAGIRNKRIAESIARSVIYV